MPLECSGGTHHPQSPRSLSKNIQTASFCDCVLDNKRILTIEFLDHWNTVNANIYCKTLKKIRHAIQIERCGKLSSRVFLAQECLIAHHKLNNSRGRAISQGQSQSCTKRLLSFPSFLKMACITEVWKW